MMITRYFLVAGLASVLIFFVGARALAQQESGDTPDQGYGAQDPNGDQESAQDQSGDQESEQGQMPNDEEDSGDNVAVPVPGGGNVQMDEPQEEAPSQIPPNENWSTHAVSPGMQGDSPQGP